MDSLVIHCQLPQIREEMVRRSCVIERKTDGKTTSTNTLWIDMPRLAVMPEENDAEPFMIMAFLPAMAEGLDLQVEGAVSRELQFSLTEFRDIWHCWDEKKFQKIEFGSSQILECQPGISNRQAVSAFSGGLDSTFTAWRHKTGTNPEVIDLQYCMMVHGFDIPLRNDSMFQRMFARCKETLKTLDLELLPVRTNCRTVFTLNWLIWHGPAVAACLQLFKGVCGVGLLGGTYGCKDQHFPFGSNPISDPMLSTAGFRIMHDGIAFSRIKKFAALQEWSAGYNALRICFTGIDKGIIKEGNCGKCSKCVRSLLRIHFANLPIPGSFPGFPSVMDIARVRPSAFESHVWRIVLREAIAKRQRLSLILAVAWMSLVCSLAKIVKKSLQAVGIWGPSFP